MLKLRSVAFVLTLVALGPASMAANGLDQLKSGIYWLTSYNTVLNSPFDAAYEPPATDTIKICKQTVPAGGTGFQFAWTNDLGPQAPFTLNDGQCEIKNIGAQVHFNTFTESVPAGWTLSNITCTNTTSPVSIVGANANPAFQPGDNKVTIDLTGPSVTCTFVNQLNPPCCSYQLDLSTGQGGAAIDPLWKVGGNKAYFTNPASSWLTTPFVPSRWIQPVAGPIVVGNLQQGLYKYTATFNVPACPSGHVALTGTFAADNRAVAYLDGVAIPGTGCWYNDCFTSPHAPVSLNLAPPIGPGPHTLQINVTNINMSESGLIVKAQLKRTCP